MKDPETLFSLPTDDLGIVRLARWPEGLVLWVGGKIVWKSWESNARPPEIVLSLKCKVSIEVEK